MIRRESAATQKYKLPRKKICTTVMDRNGCKYVHRWMGARRSFSAQGMNVPSIPPAISPEKTKIVTTNEAVHRPPRYANFEIGFVNRS